MVFLAIGVIAGILAGLFGIGGGIIIVPALLVVARFRPEMATGTSLGALLLPVGILGALYYHRHGYVDIRASLFIAVGLVVGAWLGAHLALKLTPQVLQRAFAAFMIVVAVYLWHTA